ncbi:MAG: ADP-ribosylglycohydrolase family protein, partial [SAR202 cluster bacterium]|nr:ADP-ribosylglycohydrolase family protein [SAR202 cluster bacterium]
LDDPDAMGYTFKAMQAGLWAVKQPGTLEETLVRVVSAGGDTDTNGAVAGALLGARFGEAVIPARWTECIGNRPSLERLAERLLERSLASEGA